MSTRNRHIFCTILALGLGLAACASDQPGDPAQPQESTPSGTVAAGGESVLETVTAVPELADYPMGVFVNLVDLSGEPSGPQVLQIEMTTARPVAGFQFSLTGGTPVAGQGGRAAEANFTVVSSEETGVVMGYHPTGGTIAAGAGPLTSITFQPDPGATEVCLTAPVIGDADGQSIETVLGGCLSLQ